MLSVAKKPYILSVIIPNVVILSVMAPGSSLDASTPCHDIVKMTHLQIKIEEFPEAKYNVRKRFYILASSSVLSFISFFHCHHDASLVS
jgi:hypothetical protein